MVLGKLSNDGGVLYVVATPIGNLADISQRALETLRAVALVAAEDTRHSRHLLQHFGIDKPLLAMHEHNERQALESVIHRLQAGDSVALVSDAGTPLISDPGFPLVRRCRELGLRVCPIPGASALLAALSVSGLPTDRFVFEGFLPRTAEARRKRLAALEPVSATLVFYEASHRIQDSLSDMAEVFGADRLGCVARELTKQFEDIFSAPLADLAVAVAEDADRRKGEFVVMVAGKPSNEGEELPDDVIRLLRVLADELPLKQAAALASRYTGVKKNRLYQEALSLIGQRSD